MEKTLNLIKNDPWLEPFADAIAGRHQFVLDKEAELTNILDCTVLPKAGLSVNGLLMPVIFTW